MSQNVYVFPLFLILCSGGHLTKVDNLLGLDLILTEAYVVTFM